MLPRHDIELIGAETMGSEDSDSEGWMINYLDVLTLIIAFFVVIITLTDPRVDQPQALPPELAFEEEYEASGDSEEQEPAPREGQSVLPDGLGVLPDQPAVTGLSASQQNMLEAMNNLELQGVEAIAGSEGITLRIPDNLLFESASAELTLEGMLFMEELQDLFEQFTGEISVEGHTDSQPIQTTQFPSNWELSTARAISVVRFLAEGGIGMERLRAVGYAETRPLARNITAEGRARNRRVELVLREVN